MSLVEAAAALDRLLRGHHEGGAAPNIPPYAPPPPTPDDGNLLPTFFPNAYSSKARTSSTSVEGSLASLLLPLENLPICDLDEDPFSPFFTTLSPLASPIPVPSPSLPALPSPLYSPHWLAASLEQHPSIEGDDGDLLGTDFLSKSATATDEFPRRSRRRRRSTRGNSESALGLDEEFVPLDPEKYKTELCRSFQVHSYCRYGVRCNYAHGLQELRGASRHGKYKTRNCQSYHQTGFCRYGARCSFIHDPEEGILKCSIANKEVLEALHYRPSSEDSPRTANITWRFLETSGESVPELHLISCTSPTEEQTSDLKVTPSDMPEEIISSTHFTSSTSQQQQISLLITSENGALDESTLSMYTFPFHNEVSVLNSTRLLQENIDLLRSLQTGDDTSKTEALSVSENDVNSPYSLLDSIVVDQAQIAGNSFGVLGHKLPLFESSTVVPLSLSPIKPVRIQELASNDELWENVSAKPAEEIPVKNICQELKDLEVVHTILQSAPLYSSSVWSDGTDLQNIDVKTTSDASTQPIEDEENVIEDLAASLHELKTSCTKEDEFGISKRKIRNVSRRKRKSWRKYNSDDIEDLRLSYDDRFQLPKDDNVFSSTFHSDSEEGSGELKELTGAAGTDGDEWSEKSSLHLADLLRSLRLREGSNQLVPWSKPGRRYSSDGSSAGPMSVKDPRSSPSSPASPRQHDMTKYKTELCRSFQYNGYCGYGDACLYAHGSIDLRSYPKHPMYRTKQCFSFHNKGFCLYGSRCQFLHDLE